MAGDPAQAARPSEPLVRRSVTLPLRPSLSTKARRSSPAQSPDPQVETLFVHSSVRIVSFKTTSTSTSTARSSSNNGSYPALNEEAGTLPWTSPLERLMAVGPLSIHRVPGSVAFLSCKEVMHPILPKSQCWCMDDASTKFVLQIRPPQYWRIEILAVNSDDLRISKGLKEVLSEILLFEKTPCPFQRSFTVELPEAPITPRKKRPWRPVERLKTLADAVHLPEATPGAENGEEYYSAVSDDNVGRVGMDSDSDMTDDNDITPRNTIPRSLLPSFLGQEVTSPPGGLQSGRSVTAPPQLTIITSPLSRSMTNESASSDYSSSVESFHTVQSWHSPITPLPLSPPESNPASPTTYPYPHDNISLPKRPLHTREISELTITPESPRAWEVARNSSTECVKEAREQHSPPPKTPTLVDDIEDNLDEEHFEVATPPTQQQRIRHRPTTGSNSCRRALSPLPPAANIFSPSKRRPRRLQTARHLPTAIIQKTCEILLSPPSHLIHLMLDIASKIAAGEWRGMVFGFGEGGEKVVGQWDYDDGDLMEDGWGEDDYGISLGGKQAPTSNPACGSAGRSWEVD